MSEVDDLLDSLAIEPETLEPDLDGEVAASPKPVSQGEPESIDDLLGSIIPEGTDLGAYDSSPERIGATSFDEPLEYKGVEYYGKQGLDKLREVGEFVDAYTGAPTRSALSTMIETGSKGVFEPFTPNIPEAAKSFVEQFGEPPSQAPTGQQIAGQMGVPEGAPQAIAGLAVDFLADWTLPIGGMTRAPFVAGKTAAAVSKPVLKGSAIAAKQGAKFVGMGGAADVVGEIGRVAKQSLGKLWMPGIAEDWPELQKIATKNNIDLDMLPASVKYGERNIVSRMSRAQAEGVLGQDILERFNEGLAATRNAVDSKISQIAGGYVPNKLEAGQILRDGWDRATDRIMQAADVTYDTIISQYPGLMLSPGAMKSLNSDLIGLERFAKRRALRGASSKQRARGEDLLKTVEAFRQSNGSFKQSVEFLRDLGEEAFKNENVLEIDPPDVIRLRKLYGNIREALVNTIRDDVKDGEAIAGALQINNSILSEFFNDKNTVSKILGNPKVGHESVFDALIMKGDSAKTDALKRVLSEEDWSKIKGAFIDNLIKRDDEGAFSFSQLRNAMKNKRQQVENIFTDNVNGVTSASEDVKDLLDVIRLGDRFGMAVISSSGTSAGNVLKNSLGALKDAIPNEVFIKILKDNAEAAAGGVSAAEKAAKRKAPAAKVVDRFLKAAQMTSAAEDDLKSKIWINDPNILQLKIQQIKDDDKKSNIMKAREINGIMKNKGYELDAEEEEKPKKPSIQPEEEVSALERIIKSTGP